jgi:hypothetical protein
MFVIKLVPYIWKCLSSPFDIMRSTGPFISSKLLDFYVKIRFQSLPKHEIVDYKAYMQHTLLRPASTDNALFYCFDHLLFAKHPLELDDRLGSLNLPISFFFGDRDWMLKHGSYNVLAKNHYKD